MLFVQRLKIVLFFIEEKNNNLTLESYYTREIFVWVQVMHGLFYSIIIKKNIINFTLIIFINENIYSSVYFYCIYI